MILEINNLNEIIVKVNEGSGIVLKFEADKKCYILTAYHNIKDFIEDDEDIALFINNEAYSILGKPYFDKNNDFALLGIEYIQKDIPIVNFANSIKPYDLITFMGYPNKAEDKRKSLNGKVIEWNSKIAVNVMENIQGSFLADEKTNEVFVGFSGSGVFKKDGQKLSLIGILKSLPEENFDYKEISCVPIEKISRFIVDNKLAEMTFSNPLAVALDKIQLSDERNLEDKLKVCSTIRTAKIQQYIRKVGVGKSELLKYNERDISTIKYIVFEECQDELMKFVDESSTNDELNSKVIEELIVRYAQRAKKIIDDKRNEYKYGNFSNDIIEKIILDLIDTCYLSFDEEGIYEEN